MSQSENSLHAKLEALQRQFDGLLEILHSQQKKRELLYRLSLKNEEFYNSLLVDQTTYYQQKNVLVTQLYALRAKETVACEQEIVEQYPSAYYSAATTFSSTAARVESVSALSDVAATENQHDYQLTQVGEPIIQEELHLDKPEAEIHVEAYALLSEYADEALETAPEPQELRFPEGFEHSLTDSYHYAIAKSYVSYNSLSQAKTEHGAETSFQATIPQFMSSMLCVEHYESSSQATQLSDSIKQTAEMSLPTKKTRIRDTSSKLLLLTERLLFLQRLYYLQQLRIGGGAFDSDVMQRFVLLAKQGVPVVAGYAQRNAPASIVPDSFSITDKLMRFRGFPGKHSALLIYVPENVQRVNVARCGLLEIVVVCGHVLQFLDVSGNRNPLVYILGRVQKIVIENASSVRVLG